MSVHRCWSRRLAAYNSVSLFMDEKIENKAPYFVRKFYQSTGVVGIYSELRGRFYENATLALANSEDNSSRNHAVGRDRSLLR